MGFCPWGLGQLLGSSFWEIERKHKMHPGSQVSSVLLVVETHKIIFLIENTIPQKEDIILLYIGYHSIKQVSLGERCLCAASGLLVTNYTVLPKKELPRRLWVWVYLKAL